MRGTIYLFLLLTILYFTRSKVKGFDEPSFSSVQYKITDDGAVGDSLSINTEAVQDLIDFSASKGNGPRHLSMCSI